MLPVAEATLLLRFPPDFFNLLKVHQLALYLLCTPDGKIFTNVVKETAAVLDPEQAYWDPRLRHRLMESHYLTIYHLAQTENWEELSVIYNKSLTTLKIFPVTPKFPESLAALVENTQNQQPLTLEAPYGQITDLETTACFLHELMRILEVNCPGTAAKIKQNGFTPENLVASHDAKAIP